METKTKEMRAAEGQRKVDGAALARLLGVVQGATRDGSDGVVIPQPPYSAFYHS